MATSSPSPEGDRKPADRPAAWQALAALLAIALLAVYMLTPKRIDALVQSYVWMLNIVRLVGRGA